MQTLVVAEPLAAGDSIELDLNYSGYPDASVCYPEIGDVDSVAAMYCSHYMYTMGRDYFYLSPEYTLLTPECLWYPVSKPVVNVESFWDHVQDYTRFSLSVSGMDGREVISQGKRSMRGDTVCFENRLPLQGVTLCAGNYIRKSLKSNGKQHEIYLFKGHEYLIPKNILPDEYIEFWDGIHRWDKHKAYVFDKINLVEVPVHYRAYGRDWKNNSEFVQPEIILRPEKEALLNQKLQVDTEDYNMLFASDFLGNYYYQNLADPVRGRFSGSLFFHKWLGNRENIRNESDISFYGINTAIMSILRNLGESISCLNPCRMVFLRISVS